MLASTKSWPGRRASWLIFAALSAVPVQACNAAADPLEAQSTTAQPAGGAAQLAPQFVAGPNGEKLFPFKGPTRDSVLRFEQIAKSTTEGKIINSNLSFDLMRLPATFKAVLDTYEVCTATLIGPRVILTAAHCVDTKFKDGDVWQTVKGSVARADGTAKKKFRSCAMAPAYTLSEPVPGSVRNENDFALCELVDDFAGVPAENIKLGQPAAPSGQKLLLAGFGCTNDDLTKGEITDKTTTRGILNVGFNEVQTPNGNGWVKLEGQVGSDKAILCPGDSGGASFSGVSLVPAIDDGRTIVAVNSAVGPGPQASPPIYESYLAPLSDPEFNSFVKAWSQARPGFRKICGIQLSAPAQNCRR